MGHPQNFDEQNFDELIVDFIVNTLKERKFRRKNFEPFIHQSFSLLKFCTMQYVAYVHSYIHIITVPDETCDHALCVISLLHEKQDS